MKKHNGMRPQDIAILMSIIANTNHVSLGKEKQVKIPLLDINNKTIAQTLQISESEVSESLHRSSFSGLLSDIKRKKINKRALLDFLIYGLKYVFPAHPSKIGRGIATAHSAEPLKSQIISEDNYVWEHPEGSIRGEIIEPLYPTIPFIAQQNNNLYELLALIDAIRTGSARIFKIASQELEKRLI